MSAIRSIFFLALGCHPVINLAAGFQRGLSVLQAGRDASGSDSWSLKLNLGIKERNLSVEIFVLSSKTWTSVTCSFQTSRHYRWSGLWIMKIKSLKHKLGLQLPGEEQQWGSNQHHLGFPFLILFLCPCLPLTSHSPQFYPKTELENSALWPQRQELIQPGY